MDTLLRLLIGGDLPDDGQTYDLDEIIAEVKSWED